MPVIPDGETVEAMSPLIFTEDTTPGDGAIHLTGGDGVIHLMAGVGLLDGDGVIHLTVGDGVIHLMAGDGVTRITVGDGVIHLTAGDIPITEITATHMGEEVIIIATATLLLEQGL